MTKSEQKKLDAMLDRWEKETREGRDNPGPVSDPKPDWDHREYLRKIYDKKSS